jgi:mannose-6-phosphate isomerase-like protein (cupin superfamily)
MEHAKRSNRPLAALPAVLLIALLGLAPSFTGAHQESATGTPPTSGVGGGGLSSGLPDVAPGYLLTLRRGVFEPDGYVSLHHHPGALALWIESGELTYVVSSGTAQVTRAAQDGTPGPTEQIGPGMQTILRAGDAVFEQGVMHVSRNEGAEPVVLWIAALAAADQPLTVFEQATPVP